VSDGREALLLHALERSKRVAATREGHGGSGDECGVGMARVGGRDAGLPFFGMTVALLGRRPRYTTSRIIIAF
jgi:hypothetical protein